MVSFTGEPCIPGATATPISSGLRLPRHILLHLSSPALGGTASNSRCPATGRSSQRLPGLGFRSVVAGLSGGSDGLDIIMSPPNEASLCRLRVACLFLKQSIHSISPNPSAADATPATAMPATCGLVRTGVEPGATTVDDVAPGVVADEKVCVADVGVGARSIVTDVEEELVEGKGVEVGRIGVAVTVLVSEDGMIEVGFTMLAGRDEIEVGCSDGTVCMVAVRVP